MIAIAECTPRQQGQWDDFVVRAAGTANHWFGWKQVIERTYGLRTHYLALGPAADWNAILPVAVLPRLPGGKMRAVSLPYCNYGGLLAAPGVESAPLKEAAIRHLSDLGVDTLELRERSAVPNDSGELTMILPLPETVELLWKKIGDKARNQVRKAQKAGLTLHWDSNQSDELHEIYARNMGRLGTPVHAPGFIREIVTQLPDQTDILTVRHAGRVIGAMLVIRQGTVWGDPFASCLAEFNALNPNMLLYWEALRHARESGGRSFDFGRSQQGSGTYRFKKQWGAEAHPLDYQVYEKGILRPRSSTTFYRGNTADRLSRLWQLLPAPVQRLAGPQLRRWMP